jgi:hypothetical protein
MEPPPTRGTSSGGAGSPTPNRASPAATEADGPGDPEGPGDPDTEGDPEGDAPGEPEAGGDAGPGDALPDGDGEGEADGDGEALASGVAGTGVAGGGRLGASRTTPAISAPPTTVPMTRPAAIAVLPPIGGERTSTTRPKAAASALPYHSGAMSDRPAAAAHAVRTRLLPAVLTALGVVLLTAGLLSYADPTTAGAVGGASPTLVELTPDPTSSVDLPSASADPGGSATPEPTKAAGPAHATRVVVPALKIDLPVVGGPNGYPLCDVAMYIDNLGKPIQDLGQPGLGRATYLFAHARDGMFGPIYELAIQKHQPEKMLGMIVQVYTSDDKLYLYEVDKVLLHQLSLDAAFNADTEQLWLQTSEGPRGTPGKTQLRAHLLSVGDADPADAHPKAKPDRCN